MEIYIIDNINNPNSGGGGVGVLLCLQFLDCFVFSWILVNW